MISCLKSDIEFVCIMVFGGFAFIDCQGDQEYNDHSEASGFFKWVAE